VNRGFAWRPSTGLALFRGFRYDDFRARGV
jgi:hypothetical protein